MSSCVLCGVDIVKNTDKNLVDGRKGNSFKVREELLSLECKVEINSTYICRNCLWALKKRRALLNNLHEVNSSIQKIVQSKKCSAVPLPVPTPPSNQISDSQEQATKRVALEDFGTSVTSMDIEEDNSTLPNRTVVTGCFANESFRQGSFRKRLWSVRKRVEVSSQTCRNQFTYVNLRFNYTVRNFWV